MPSGGQKNWSRLCMTLNAFFARHGRWRSRARLGAAPLDDLRGHVFTPKLWATIYAKLSFIVDGAVVPVAPVVMKPFA